MTIVDIHTHVYPPKYIELLKSRQSVPFIRNFADAPNNSRLIILPGEDDPSTPSTSRGRPVNDSYWDINKKIEFMDAHDIDVSVISLANPWLDFVDADAAAKAAEDVNNEIEGLCEKLPGRLYAFAALPISGGAEAVVHEISRLKGLKWVRGVILGTSGLGNGLDDPALSPVWRALQDTNTIAFIHPHYGLPKSSYGDSGQNYGHVLPLALGFPLETTIAIAKMYLHRTWDEYPNLKLLLAHSGGTIPFLAGRIESCIAHDAHMKHESTAPQRSIWTVLKENLYLDAVIYGDVGLSAAAQAAGIDRLMFGTDHPFFPPLGADEKKWLSVSMNLDAIRSLCAQSPQQANMILGENAIKVLSLEEERQ